MSTQGIAQAPPVRVRARIPAPVDRVWAALAEPGRLACWFGAVEAPWKPGGTGRITFGDGDFFAVTVLRVEPRRLIELDWSFLGVGPVQRVRWLLHADDHGTDVVMEDHDPARRPAETQQMVAGWTDFIGRLAGYVRTGAATRYAWREEIDGSVDLPGHWRPLELAQLYRWLPIASDGFTPRWFFVVDADGPRRFAIEKWRLVENHRVTYWVEIPEATARTLAEIVVTPQPDGQRLRFTHLGWRDLGLPDQRARTLRCRFADAWTAAIAQPRQLAAGGGD